MTEQPQEPKPERYAPGAPLPDIYPPPPEYYQQRAQAAPSFVTPGAPPGHEYLPPREQPLPRRRRFWRARAAGQPITEADIAMTFLSAAISFAVYTWIMGWRVALGLTILLFIHEMGHFVVSRRKGMYASLPIFVPLMGAFVRLSQAPSAKDEAEVALAGPFAGALGSVLCFIAAAVAGYAGLQRLDFLQYLGLINLAINMFNLLPIAPLDGAYAARMTSKWVIVGGLLLIAVAGLCSYQILVTLVAVVAIIMTLARRSNAAIARYYVSRREQRYVTLLYGGLMFGCFALAFVASSGWVWFDLLSYLFR